jgi:hypothetical protein
MGVECELWSTDLGRTPSLNPTSVGRSTHMEYLYYPTAFVWILRNSLALLFIYCRYKSNAGQLIALRLACKIRYSVSCMSITVNIRYIKKTHLLKS